MSDTQPREEYYFNSKELADPNCPRCQGNGTLAKKLKSGMLQTMICPCTQENNAKIAAKMRLTRLMPGMEGRMTFDNYNTGGDPANERALSISKNFIKEWRVAYENGWTLGFYGDKGSGKTHLAAAITSELVYDYLIKPYFLSVSRLAQLQRESFEEKDGLTPLQLALEADLLVLDDIGAEYVRQQGDQPSWLDDLLFQITDERVKAGKPILYTTNYNKSTMKRLLDDPSKGRIWERLMRNAAMDPIQVMPVRGENRPNAKFRNLLLGESSENKKADA